MSRSKAIAGIAAGLLLTLATSAVRAEGPVPASGVRPLAESATPAESAVGLTDSTELDFTELDSTELGALAAGLGLGGVGSLSAVGGGVAYVTLSAHTSEGCEASSTACVDEHKAGKSAGILAMVLGGAAVAVGIPLIIGSMESLGKGEHQRGAAGGSAVLAPELRLAVGAASLTWSF